MVIIPSCLIGHIHASTAYGAQTENAALQKDSGQGRGGGVV
jgi:hypothetical protein